MSDTRQVARRYFDAWTSGDGHTVASLLAPDCSFSAGDLRIDGREALLAGGAFPRDATGMAAFAAFAGAGAGTEGSRDGGRA